MGVILKYVGKSPNVPYKTFETDTFEEMQAIDTRYIPMSSRCYVINEQKLYALNSEKQWVIVPLGDGGGAGSSVDPTDPTWLPVQDPPSWENVNTASAPSTTSAEPSDGEHYWEGI